MPHFDLSGISRDARGVAHYDNRPDSLVAMLRATVVGSPGHDAIVDLDGSGRPDRRLTYR